ncbi:hypothetical protein M2324_003648 [Rhodovulum sulfidophilum]|nr:hypothetical protein [Rhodovulum sulfidophilum]
MTAAFRASTAEAAVPNRRSGSPYNRGDADRYEAPAGLVDPTLIPG